jgi:dTDP-4-amino-4,6-dideoxygalactose transaminase
MKKGLKTRPPIPLVDLKAQYLSIKAEIDQAISEVVASQQFRLGPQVFEFEKHLASYCGTKFACGVSSGTDALLMALMCEEIGAGDEVITTAHTFFATAGSIARVGAQPVFVDIDPSTYTIDTNQIEKKITANTRAIIPVHLYGHMADMNSIMKIAKKKNLVVIEDAAQAIGSEYEGRRAGSIGDYGCFSFFPAKNLGAFGDGGAVILSDVKRLEKLIAIREHGADTHFNNYPYVGGNFRLDTIQAAVLMTKLSYLEGWLEKRRSNATLYAALFNAAGLVSGGHILLPIEKTGRHTYHQYILKVKRRDELRTYLKSQNITCGIYYPTPTPLHKCFAHLGYKEGDFPESEKVCQETLAIPVYSELSSEQIKYIVSKITSFYIP